MSPAKLKIFFQDLHRDSRHKLGNQRARVAHFFGSCTNRRKRNDLEASPILELADNELKEANYGATGSFENEVCETAMSATRRAGQYGATQCGQQASP